MKRRTSQTRPAGRNECWLPSELWTDIFDALLNRSHPPWAINDRDDTAYGKHSVQLRAFLSMRRVCTAWCQRCATQLTHMQWSTLLHTATHCNSAQLLRLFPAVQQLAFTPDRHPNELARVRNVQTFIERSTRLTTLRYNATWNAIYIGSIPRFESMTQLHALWYTSDGVTPRYLQKEAYITLPSALVELRLVGIDQHRGHMWVSAIQALTALRSLTVHSVVAHLPDTTYRHLTTLVHMDLQGQRFALDPDGGGRCIKNLTALVNLTDLTLSPHSGGDDAVMRAMVAQYLPSVTTLRLCNPSEWYSHPFPFLSS